MLLGRKIIHSGRRTSVTGSGKNIKDDSLIEKRGIFNTGYWVRIVSWEKTKK